MHHLAVINDQVAFTNWVDAIANEILPVSFGDKNQFNGLWVHMHEPDKRTIALTDLTHIRQLGLSLILSF
ncbi:Uncharacterised protein [Salmonella enterica subsp. enterica serovar Typhimurium str. DT104]|nr:Uncharacterised protein [Salmonella enterica subsp. enterica serovar Typhimurium str. DT104]